MAIPAAGTIPWRVREGTLEVALVHRPKYDDWSWPKGKLDPDEQWPVAAVRETHEETGLKVTLGRALPTARYLVLGRGGRREEKLVQYWAAQVTGGSGKLVNEIDEVRWLAVPDAHDTLDYQRDREQLLALVRDHRSQSLETWPLVLVRHAQAVPRSAFDGPDDRERPLTPRGEARAAELPAVLSSFGVRRFVTSSSTRCVQTLEPAALAAGRELRRKDALSEEGYAEDPGGAVRQVEKALGRGKPVAICGHGPVLPAMLDVLADHLDRRSDRAVSMIESFAEARDEKLIKGEALVAHVVGVGETARIVDIERHLP